MSGPTRGFVAAPPSTDRVPWWLIAIFTVVLIGACIHQLWKDWIGSGE